jgi:hypothetical protein
VPSRRTLATGIHALRSLVGNLATPSWLRSVSQRRLDWHGPTPREPAFRFRACCRNRSLPARAGGTAGRWALPAPDSRKPLTTTTPNPRAPPTNPRHFTEALRGSAGRGRAAGDASRPCRAALIDCCGSATTDNISGMNASEPVAPTPVPLDHHPRPSRCIRRSQELERKRIERLSVEERIRMALGLRGRIVHLLQAAEATDSDAPSTRPA